MASKVLFGILTVVLASGCDGAGGFDADVAPNSGPDAGSQSGPVAVRGELRWHPCDGSMECAVLLVPLDYDDPTGATIELALQRRRAKGARIGSLFVNPGGPGASAISWLADIVVAWDGGELLQRFDLVAFDPRGVGASTAIDCHSMLQKLVAIDPGQESGWSAVDKVAADFAAECAKKAGTILPYLGTREVARDMDQIREALREDKLNYLGFSYGTEIGAWYAELFPERIRAMVLDGAVDLSLSALDQNLQQAQSFEQALRRYEAWCSQDPLRCAWTDKRPADVALHDLTIMVRTRPLPALQADRPAGPGELFLALAAPLYGGVDGWKVLSLALGSAMQGDGSALVKLADLYLGRRQDGSYPNKTEVNAAVNSADMIFPSVSELRAATSTFEVAAPRFGLPILEGMLLSAHLPASRGSTGVPSGYGAPPIIVIGTTGDPATPYAWAQAMSKQLSSAILFTREGEGHTAYGKGVTCVDRAVNSYFINGTLPVSGTRCASNTDAVPKRVGLTYQVLQFGRF